MCVIHHMMICWYFCRDVGIAFQQRSNEMYQCRRSCDQEVPVALAALAKERQAQRQAEAQARNVKSSTGG